MFTALVPLVMVLVGGVIYLVASNTFVKEIGRLVLMAGLFAFAFSMSGRTLAL